MKSPIKFENDFREYSKAEKVTLVVVLVLVTLVIISWASQGFAFSEKKSTYYRSGPSHTFGYKAYVTTSINHSEGENNKT
jgi:hypothetical protein